MRNELARKDTNIWMLRQMMRTQAKESQDPAKPETPAARGDLTAAEQSFLDRTMKEALTLIYNETHTYFSTKLSAPDGVNFNHNDLNTISLVFCTV